MNWIAERISNARKTKGLTQEELAEFAKVNVRTIQRIENSENVPRGKTLNLICEVLDIDVEELNSVERGTSSKNIGTKIINSLFLIVLNLILMAIIGYLTLDSNANWNSRFGGVLISFFLPFFIVFFTKKMSGVERMLKFGTGYIIYFIMITLHQGFPKGFITGLFPCFLISLSVLYYGNELLRNRE
ncbi:helix-turn-helix domain-containing protein [Flavobacterium sp.]|uniref:helix-turn-helix domain-containing protein n=1 Tax=Flavobacterium sp. TaxID=239 RepID=UPI0035277DB4